MDKDYLSNFTLKHPDILEIFKKDAIKKAQPMNGNILDSINIEDICNILSLKLNEIPYGSESASDFHNLMIGILELLLYPNLINPKKEEEINEGRKRIDICFTNDSEHGFFTYVPEKVNIPCPLVFIECKNYSKDIKNPELDQMIGRFSTRRGRLGIISCRKIDDEKLFLARCADTFKDDNGLIIPITDEDIQRCLKCGKDCSKELENVLYEKSRIIIKG